MNEEVTFWVASHLTGIFEIRDKARNILSKGSRGAGLSINRGVTTTISFIKESPPKIFYNGEEKTTFEAKVTSDVINFLIADPQKRNLKVSHNFDIPLSSGFGASAAGALGTAFALNVLLKLNLSDLELFQVAHCAEVQNKTGLGDIIGIYQGGLELRLKEGAPGYGEVTHLKNTDNWKVATVHFGPLSTSNILSDPVKRKLVNEAGGDLISDLIRNPTFIHFINLSVKFTNNVKLWSPQVEKSLRNLPDEVIGSQIMLGEGIFLFYQEEAVLDQLTIPRTNIVNETICQKTVLRIK